MIKKQDIVDVLKLIESRDRIITPKSIVHEASNESSPIHDYFEWDNDRGAEKYRIWQARQLISSIRIEWLGKEVDGYHNVIIESDNDLTQGYVSVQHVVSNEGLHKQVLNNALRELAHWRDKYKELTELKGIINNERLSEVVSTI